MAMKTALAVVGTGALLTLQGCGSDGPSPAPAGPSPPAPGPTPAPGPSPEPTPAPPAPPTTVVTTTTLPPNPTAPLSGADVAALMNQEFTSFDPNNEQGSMGAMIRITGDMIIYCHSGCYQGYADCRVSASFYNPTQIVSSDGTIEWSYTGTGTDGDFLGMYFNQTLVRQSVGKCSYIGDGGTDDKYNMGCGAKASSECTNDCDDVHCAFLGLDPATNYETPITKDSDVVKNAVIGDGCNDPGLCGYKGPAWWKEDGLVPDEMFKAAKWRAENTPGTADWNEIILDGEQTVKELHYNPAAMIPAIVYASTFPGGLEAGKTAARAMAQKMADDYNMPTPVPIVKIDLSVNVVNGGSPFVFEDTASEELTV